MTEKRLVRCTQCNTVACFSSLDRSPEYRRKGAQWETLERDDHVLFLEAHRGHQLEELRMIEGSFISQKHYVEPVKAGYFEATNGRQRFVVKKSRESFLEPQRYELVPGRIRRTPAELWIDRVAIVSLLETVFSPPRVSSTSIGRFVDHLQYRVSRLDPKELTRAPFESRNPSLWYYDLDQKVVKKALRDSCGFLTRGERQRLGAFIRRNLETEIFKIQARIEFEIDPAKPPSSQDSN